MGIFSSKTVIQVGTSVTPLVEQRPNLAQVGVLKAVLNNTDMSSTILSTMLAGYNITPHLIYNTAKDLENYFLGLPASTKPRPTPQLDKVEDVVLAYENATEIDVSFNEKAYRNPTADDIAKYLIQFVTTYDPQQGWYTSVPNLPEGWVAILKGYRQEELNPPDSRDEFNWLDPNRFLLTYDITRFDPSNRASTEEDVSFSISSEDIETPLVNDLGAMCYVVDYSIRTSGFKAQNKMFLYDPNTDIYPELDTYPPNVREGEYFPIVPLRLNKEFIEEGSTKNPQYVYYLDQIDKMMKLFSLDRVTLQENLATNPDINDIEASYVLMSVPIGLDFDLNSEKKQGTLEYLNHYFRYLITQQEYFKEDFEANNDLYNVISIKDAKMQTFLHWNYVEIYEGTYDPEALQYRLAWDIRDTEFRTPWNTFNFYSDDGLRLEIHDHKTQTCEVVHVHGLYHMSDVYKGKQEINRIYDAFHPNEEARTNGFFIPLNYTILSRLASAKQTAVALDSICLVNYAVQKTKVKWYQRGAFAILVQIAIVVIAVVSQNYALLSAGTLTASQVALLVLQAVVVSIITGALLKPILKVLIDILGIEIVAVIAAVLAILGVIDMAGIADLSSTLPSAQTLLQISTELTTGLGEAIGREIADMQQDYFDFLKEAQNVQEEIDAILETFNVNDFTSNVVMQSRMYETPDQFFMRTNTIDIGLMTLDTIDYFYENALNLDRRY